MKTKRYRITTYSGEIIEYEITSENDKIIVKQLGSDTVFETYVEKIDEDNYVVQIGYDKYRVSFMNNRVFIDREEPLISNIVEVLTPTKPTITKKEARKEEKPVVVKTEKGEIKAPLSGKIESIRVKPGDRVRQGDVVLTMISMKMSVEVKSNISGVVEEIFVKTGDVVKTGDLLMRIRIE